MIRNPKFLPYFLHTSTLHMENPMENPMANPMENPIAKLSHGPTRKMVRFRRLRSALVPGYLQGTALPRPLQRRSACLFEKALAMERLKGHGFVTFNRYQNRRNMRKYWIIHFWYVWTCFKCVLFFKVCLWIHQNWQVWWYQQLDLRFWRPSKVKPYPMQ